MNAHATILGLGTYLPDLVRRNDHWPATTVRKWERLARKNAANAAEAPTAGLRAALAAVTELQHDPFQGAIERRTMPPSMLSSDMEAAAAKAALSDAGVRPEQVDFVLCYSGTPDYISVQNAAIVHQKLGLPERCMCVSLEAGCNTFLMQLSHASGMLASGARIGLLVQSCAASRLVPEEDPLSAWFGDGATAVVVGPSAGGSGLLSAVHRTDGARHKALVCGVRDGHWYDDGRVTFYSDDPRAAKEMMMTVTDRSRDIIAEAISEAGLTHADVGFYACHQGMHWLRRVTQQFSGLGHAKTVDTFPWAGSLSAGNIPLVLLTAKKERLLASGDVVVMFSGGTGETWSALVLRWGFV